MTKFFDEEGNEVSDVLTTEEANIKIEEGIGAKVEEAKKESAEKITTLETDLAKANEDLKNKNPNAENFKQTKEIIKGLEGKLEEEKTARLESVKVEKTAKTEKLIKKFAGEDAELEKKIRFNLENSLSGAKAETEDEISKNVVDAYKLSKTEDTMNPLDSALGGNSFITPNVAGNDAKFSTKEKELGGRLGISGDDYDKYGKDPRINN